MRTHSARVTLLWVAIVAATLLGGCRGDIAPVPEAASPVGKQEGLASLPPAGVTPSVAPRATMTPNAPSPVPTTTPRAAGEAWSEGLSVVVERVTTGETADILVSYSGGSPYEATVRVAPETRLRHLDGHWLEFSEVQVGDLLHVVGERLDDDPLRIRAGWILVVPWRPPRSEGVATEDGHGPAHTIVAVVATVEPRPEVGYEVLRLEPPHDGWVVQLAPDIPIERPDGRRLQPGDITPGARIGVAGGSSGGALGDGDPLYARMILLLDR